MNIDGRPGWIRPFFRSLEFFYSSGRALREKKFLEKVAGGDYPLRLPVPVISVGNLTVGGVGKTPVVELLARNWLQRGGVPAILSRGYKSGITGFNDEYLLLKRRLPEVSHWQNPDRYQSALQALKEDPRINLFILDDGFQHRRLHRAIDLLLIDCMRPLGGGAQLPAGWLREPWQGMRRANAIIFTRVQHVHPQKMEIIKAFFRDWAPAAKQGVLIADAPQFRDASGAMHEKLPAGKMAAFAGIGNPQNFFKDLLLGGISLAGERAFPDHHAYRPGDLKTLLRWGKSLDVKALLCTEKDGVKLELIKGFSASDPPIFQVSSSWKLNGLDPLLEMEKLGHLEQVCAKNR